MAFLGMDVDDVRTYAERLRDAQGRIADRRAELEGSMARLQESWRGPDAEAFRQTWDQSIIPKWSDALEGLQRMADTAVADAEEQDVVSGIDGSRSPGDGLSSTQTISDIGDNGQIDENVRSDWSDMEENDQKLVLQEMVDQEFQRYGMEPVEIEYFYEEPDPKTGLVTFGSWNEETQTLRLNEYLLDHPELMLTTVHEVRHAAQNEFIEQTEPGFWDFLPFVDSKKEDYERIEQENGITREEIEAWRENFEPGNYISPDEDFQGYQNQPVEVDAREQEDRFADGLTEEELERYKRNAGVTDEE